MLRHASIASLAGFAAIALLLSWAPLAHAEGVSWTVDFTGDAVAPGWTTTLTGGARIAHERAEAREVDQGVRLSRTLPSPMERIEVRFVGELRDAARGSSLALVLAGAAGAIRLDHQHGGDVAPGQSVVRVTLPEAAGPVDTPSDTHAERFPSYLHEVVLSGRALTVTVTDLRTGAVVASLARADVGLPANAVSLIALAVAHVDGPGATWLDDVHVDLAPSPLVAAVCGPDDPPTSADCDGACDAVDLPGSPDCDGLCGANDDFVSPDCDPQWYCNHFPGGPCDDGDPCTTDDSCRAGSQCKGDPRDCSALTDPCNGAVCDEDAGYCKRVPINIGAACDDQNPCTVDDHCDATGACASDPKDCSTFDDICNSGSCNHLGVCETEPINEGGPCDDHDPCTVGDLCNAAGGCAGAAVDCSGLDDACVEGYCDAAGSCRTTPVNGGGPCDDGDPCTLLDACGADGVCAGGEKDCSSLDDACHLGACDDGGACGATPANAGGACDDGDPCTIGDLCDAAGGCAGTPVDCSGLDGACKVGQCNASGACVAAAANVGGACDDGDPCTLGDACGNGGVCVGAGIDCSELDDPCHAGTCDGAGGCVALTANAGGACDDLDPCTRDDVCAADGSCAGVADDCAELTTACSVGMCDAQGGCVGVPANLGGGCDDGDPCTVLDACGADGGCAGVAKDCSGLDDACHVGTCDASGACVAAPANLGATCDDGDGCTVNDRCGAGGGCAGSPRDCSGLDDTCHEGTCEAASGTCVATPARVGGACSDADPCTVTDVCGADGVCAGSAIDCAVSESPICNLAACNPLRDLDGDGVIDTADGDPQDPTACADADADGCDDCALTGPDGSGGDVARDGPDADADGACDVGDDDDDGDGIDDDDEAAAGSDPYDADTDGDGLADGDEVAAGTSPVDVDSDDDGLSDSDELSGGGRLAPWGATDPTDPDSDGDGLLDGLEVGVTAPIPGGHLSVGPAPVEARGTDLDRGVFRADADPSSITDPTSVDTDGGTVPDGIEDVNRDGAVDHGERNPVDPTDDVPVVTTPKDGGGCAGAGGQGAAGALALALLALAATRRRPARVRRSRSR